MPLIMVTNDDGISSQGIKILAKTLRDIGDVYVVAPETEQSAVAHALTLHRPLLSRRSNTRTYFVNGTPTDCVIAGVNKLLPKKPDLLISGINNGGNLGDNVTYSGTVAAAMEGTMLGIPSLAFSLVLDNNNMNKKSVVSGFKTAAGYARRLAEMVIERGLPDDTLLNVNVPVSSQIRGMRITKQGKLIYDNAIHELNDPTGKKYYWIGGGIPQWEAGKDTDFEAIQDGYVSITPVHLDLTNYRALDYLKTHWNI